MWKKAMRLELLKKRCNFQHCKQIILIVATWFLPTKTKKRTNEIAQQSHNPNPSQDVLDHKNLVFFFFFFLSSLAFGGHCNGRASPKDKQQTLMSARSSIVGAHYLSWKPKP